jgi:hypothetical protein
MKHIVVIFILFVLATSASAQVSQPQMILTWQAETYTPPDFSGKALPIADSRIIAGVDLIDGGARTDLSGQRINWYLNDDFYQGGPGLTRVNFPAPHIIGATSIRLRVSIPDYGSGAGKTIIIPVVPPEAVITSSAPGLEASAVPFVLEATPYFFNVRSPSDLQYVWSINKSPVGAGNPFTATEEIAKSGSATTLELRVSNPLRTIERISRKLTLFLSQ